MSSGLSNADVCREHADGITHVFPLPYPDSDGQRVRLLRCALADEQVSDLLAQVARSRFRAASA